jgi:hypothetical protein
VGEVVQVAGVASELLLQVLQYGCLNQVHYCAWVLNLRMNASYLQKLIYGACLTLSRCLQRVQQLVHC